MTQPVAMNLTSPETKDYNSVLSLARQHLNQLTDQRVSAVARAKDALDEKYGFDSMDLEARLEMEREAESVLNCPQTNLRVVQTQNDVRSAKAEARRRAWHRRKERERISKLAEIETDVQAKVNGDGEAKTPSKAEVGPRNGWVRDPEAWFGASDGSEAQVVAALSFLKQHADVDVEVIVEGEVANLEINNDVALSSTVSKTSTASGKEEAFEDEQVSANKYDGPEPGQIHERL